ncbi:unnamed protein product [Peronospora belbahrii]|uniref:ELYS-like domain-containing protein n=1 Tax=Peronospora belbahrii TaxID=622444 RepID=A0ABN8CZX0_9STRA|nr:unnamed protein product [Peronospora belbahrii]
MKSCRLKELVQSVTLLPVEEKLFHTCMMECNIIMDEDVLRDDNIKRVDFLVMYYVLRNKYEQAWHVHHEHLAMIRAMSRGDTEIALAALGQPSLRIRAALLSNMCPESTPKSYSQRSRNANAQCEGRQRQRFVQPALFENVEMKDVSDSETSARTTFEPTEPISRKVCAEEKQTTPFGSAFVDEETEPLTRFQEMVDTGKFCYSPGVFSSRRGSSVSTRSAEPPTPVAADKKTPTLLKDRGKSIAANVTGLRDVARQSLNFGPSPAKPSSAPSTPLQHPVSSFGDRRPLGTPPMRTKINPIFASTSLPPYVSKAAGSTNDFSLKPRNVECVTDISSPVEVQSPATVATDVPENRTVQQASTPPPDLDSAAVVVTPKRYQFVREPLTNPRLEVAHSNSDYPMSPATEELEGMMEPERIDEEFSTPISRLRGRRKEPASAPVRRNPRRSTRQKY